MKNWFLFKYLLISALMIALMTIGNFVGLQVLGLDTYVFVPAWLVGYYCLDFWLNRKWVFSRNLTPALLFRVVLYNLANWAGTICVSIFLIEYLKMGPLGSTLSILMLFPARFLVQKKYIYK